MSDTILVQTGPKTALGRAASARNSLKHGLTALTPVLLGVESEDEWQRHLAGVTDSLLPQTHLEEILVERVSLLLWRLRRVARYERDVTANAHAELETYYTSPASLLQQAAQERAWENLPGAQAGTPIPHVSLVALIDLLPALPGYSLLRREPVMQVIRAFIEAAGGMDLPPILSGLGGYDDPLTQEAWDREWLIEALRRVAARAGTNWIALKQKVLLALSPGIAVAQANGRERLARARAANLLPQPDVIDRVMRYEAHLNRQLLSALHELEALQARRVGQPVPLARLEVTGIPEDPGES